MGVFTGLTLLAAAVQSVAAAPSAPPTAPSTTPAAALDPARLAAAQAFVSSLDPERQLDRNLDSMVDLTVRQMVPEIERQTGQPLPEASRQRIGTAMRADMAEIYAGIFPDMMRGMAEAYASLFTVAELRRMGELMRDPLMQRMVEVMPEMMQRTFDRVHISPDATRMPRMVQVISELIPRPTHTTTTTRTTTRTVRHH